MKWITITGFFAFAALAGAADETLVYDCHSGSGGSSATVRLRRVSPPRNGVQWKALIATSPFPATGFSSGWIDVRSVPASPARPNGESYRNDEKHFALSILDKKISDGKPIAIFATGTFSDGYLRTQTGFPTTWLTCR